MWMKTGDPLYVDGFRKQFGGNSFEQLQIFDIKSRFSKDALPGQLP